MLGHLHEKRQTIILIEQRGKSHQHVIDQRSVGGREASTETSQIGVDNFVVSKAVRNFQKQQEITRKKKIKCKYLNYKNNKGFLLEPQVFLFVVK